MIKTNFAVLDILSHSASVIRALSLKKYWWLSQDQTVHCQQISSEPYSSNIMLHYL